MDLDMMMLDRTESMETFTTYMQQEVGKTIGMNAMLTVVIGSITFVHTIDYYHNGWLNVMTKE